MKKIPLGLCLLISIAFSESGLSNSYMGYKNYGIASDQFAFEKAIKSKNINDEGVEYEDGIRNAGQVDIDILRKMTPNERSRMQAEPYNQKVSHGLAPSLDNSYKQPSQHEQLKIQQEKLEIQREQLRQQQAYQDEQLNIQRQQQQAQQKHQEEQESRDAWNSISQSLNSIGNAFNQSANQMNQDSQNRRTNYQLQQINNGINNLNSNSKLRPITPNFY